jgi:lipopolysaccharide transport system permease protein
MFDAERRTPYSISVLTSSRSERVAGEGERHLGRAMSHRPPAGVRAHLSSTFDLLVSLTASDLLTRYGRGPFLIVRWLFEPFAVLGVYLILIGVVLDRPGNATGLSLACAIVPFQLIMLSVTNAMTAVSLRRPIIQNMAFRRSLIPVSSVLTESASFVASFTMIVLMMAIYGVAPTAAILWLPVVIAVTGALAIGFAYPCSIFGLWFWELRPFGVSLVRVLFFLGPGLVPLSQTGKHAEGYLRWNPLTGLFESFRDVFLYGRSPEAWELLYPLGVAAALLAIFIPLYRRDQREFAKVVP